MSINRRRWSNELLDSLMEFQNRESSQLTDSIENEKTACTETTTKSEDEQDTDITTMLASLKLQSSPAVSICSKGSSEDSYVFDVVMSDYANSSERSESPFSVLNLNVTEEVQAKSSENLIRFSMVDDHFQDNKEPKIKDILNTSMSEDNTIQNQSNKTPVQSDSTVLNERVMEDSSSDSGTIKLSSCNSSEQNITDLRVVENYFYQYSKHSTDVPTANLLNLNEKIIESHTISSDSGTIKVSSYNSSTENIAEKNISEEQSIQIKEICKQDEIHHRFFSSPVELFKDLNTEQLITEMEMPDVWDALLSLEEALSPIDENKESVHERSLEHGHILTRLSQKFKQTPTRFTEKLVSIIEDSIVSSESPTKQGTGDTSGISLHRMTGEFRKLCKFIDDESMPEWAPSLINMTTCLEKTESPEYEKNKTLQFETPKCKKNEENMKTPKNMIRCINDTPSKKYIPKSFDNFVTPKNKNITPIKQFTPSADKSFEYWESICNMMSENKASGKKNKRVSLASKKSMEEMLTICELQMASLDESNIAQVPRSKSVSKMFSKIDEQPEKSSSVKTTEKTVLHNDLKSCEKDEVSKNNPNKAVDDTPEKDTDVIQSEEMNASDDSYVLCRRMDTNLNDDTFENNFQPLPRSPMENSFMGTKNSYDYLEDDPDCSLMIELAKRRQRCLDTAKLMMEIEKEDPNTSGDTTCLETLYKLGTIQDKTFAEVEDDAKFLNTLGHCLEYKNYLHDKSKPIKNMLQKFDSPEDFRKKTASALKSKKSLQQKPSSSTTKTHQASTLNKPRIEQRSHLKSVQDRIVTPRIVSKSTSKVPPRSEPKRPSSNIQQTKATPRLLTKPTSSNPSLVKATPTTASRLTSRISTKTTVSQPKKITPTSTTKSRTTTSAVKAPQSSHSLAPSKRLTTRTTPKTSPLKTTQFSSRKRITSKISPMTATQPLSQMRITPKSSPVKVSQPSSQKRSVTSAKPKLSIPKIVLTPDGESTPVLREKQPKRNLLATETAPKLKLFSTPGKSPTAGTFGRKKPQSYFSDSKKPATTPSTPFLGSKQTSAVPQNTLDNVQSPIGLYIKATDNDLIQNVQAHTNDWLLTPISNGEDGKTPQLKIKLNSKENKSPSVHCDENIVLPTIRYHSAKKIYLIDQKSPTLRSLTPNSKTKKLLGPIENTVVIRHEGRVPNDDSKASCPDSEMSIHVQKIAEKAKSMRRNLM